MLIASASGMNTRKFQERGTGRIEVITGGMFSGKSEELVRRLRRALIAKQKTVVFKPASDTRTPPGRLITRDNRELAAQAVRNSAELLEAVSDDVQVVGIDEAQFFDPGLVGVVNELADNGRRVIIAGLDQDFQRQPFGPMPDLMAMAEFVDKTHAVCVRCGGTAHYSQRIAGGASQVLVGDVETYEARCRNCFEPYSGEPTG